MATQTEVTPSLVFSQKGRAISVETALGPDELLLEKFEGEEELSGNFHYTLGLLSKNPGISAAKMIRTPATLRITLGDGGTRTIHGMISRFAQSEQLEGLTVYEAELVPWFSLLAWSSDFCTFQNMTIPDIVRAVCKEQGFTDITMKLVKPHPPHEYRVQYGETHLAFLSRLMEEEGMFTFYEPDGKNLVVADDNSAAKQTVKVRMATLMHETGDDSVLQSFAVTQEVRPGKCTMIDYNFETPSIKLVSETPGKQSVEVVEYPAGFGKREEGDRLARLRHEEEMGESVEAHGTGRCRALRAGVKLELSNHANKAFNGPYLVTSVRQKGKLGEFRSGGDGEFEFSSSFTATPFDTPYRPERSAPAPRAYGYESAVVVGPSGEEIYTDKYGRVKVQFFWDRRGTKDDKSSCWVRVSTLWAGKGVGFIHTPLIGQEVLVAFLNGDPEDPIVVGRVWNAEQMPPYALPANKTQSGVKTRSSMHGTPDNFNEIRFEDKIGSEQLFIHAEKNLDSEVENDETHSVGHDRTKRSEE